MCPVAIYLCLGVDGGLELMVHNVMEDNATVLETR